jgi:hypothetical protein
VHAVVETLSGQAAVIEVEKLKAIGQRNLAEAERDSRRRKAREVQALVDERGAELARLEAELASLTALEAEQRDMIERLSNNEAGVL